MHAASLHCEHTCETTRGVRVYPSRTQIPNMFARISSGKRRAKVINPLKYLMFSPCSHFLNSNRRIALESSLISLSIMEIADSWALISDEIVSTVGSPSRYGLLLSFRGEDRIPVTRCASGGLGARVSPRPIKCDSSTYTCFIEAVVAGDSVNG